MADPGTFEQIAMLLGDTLSPLTTLFARDNAAATLGRLGLHIPDKYFTSGLLSSLGSAATAAADLPDLIGDLAGAIEVDAGGIEIAAKSAPLAIKAVTIIDAFVQVGNQLQALSNTGVSPAELQAFAEALPGRLLELLLIENLERTQPAVTNVLALIGVVDYTKVNVGSTDPLKPEVTRKSLRFDRIGTLFDDPEDLLDQLYHWGASNFATEVLLDRLYGVLAGVGLPVARGTVGTPSRPTLDLFLARIAATPPNVNPPGLDATIALALTDGLDLTIPITGGLDFELKAVGAVGASAGIQIKPPADVTIIPPSGQVQGRLSAGIGVKPAPGKEAVTLLGVPGGSRLEAKRISLALISEFSWTAPNGPATGDFGFEGKVQGGKLVITLAGADGFIGEIMSGFGIEADFDIGFGWTAGSGVYFTGSGGLEVKVPTHIELGPIEITALTLRIDLQSAGGGQPFGIPISLSADISAMLGPIQAAVEGIGATAKLSFPDDNKGNLGAAQLDFAFKPPNGVGLAIDVGVVKGGGYLFIDTQKGEYAGVLELVLADFLEIRAIGLITTKNPDGSPGFSLLIILTAEFPGGLQLGYGFKIIGLGGLLGINRRMNLQALMEGVRTNAVESVMFPHDVIANAPRILSDLRTLFPAQPGTFLVGPMLKLGWMTPTLVSVAVGVIIEIPGNIAIVGVLKVALPDEDEVLLQLQVNFAGAIEFDKKRLYFFAALYESRVLFMTIEGEMGLLVAWGDDANFVLSVGGFHPSFKPPPLPFPSPKRISINIIDTDYARVRAMGYFAVTSNTVQFGSRVEVFFGFSGFSVEGFIQFDALFQFSPFYFIIEVSAGFELKAFGVGCFSVRVHMSLEGPTPWRAKGTGSISLLFFEISADFDVTWGDGADTMVEAADVMPVVAGALGKDQAWKANRPPGTNLLVSLRSLDASNDPADSLVLHPLGSLQVHQSTVPLDLSIAKVGNQKAKDATKFTLSVTSAGLAKAADIDDRFAIAQFQDMDDAAKLSKPAFQRQHGGLELKVSGAGAGTGRMTRRIARYEEVIIDNRYARARKYRFRALSGVMFDHLLAGAAITYSPFSQSQAQQLDPHGDAITLTGDSYTVASTVDNSSVVGATTFASQASAEEHMASLLEDDPSMADSVHVIPTFEMNGA